MRFPYDQKFRFAFPEISGKYYEFANWSQIFGNFLPGIFDGTIPVLQSQTFFGFSGNVPRKFLCNLPPFGMVLLNRKPPLSAKSLQLYRAQTDSFKLFYLFTVEYLNEGSSGVVV